jgi:hypothetical protein
MFMKTTKIFLLLIAMLFAVAFTACGGGDEGGGGGNQPPVDSTPSISNLQYSPSSATLNQGGGAITVYGSYDFIDHGGDLNGGFVTIKVYDQNNNLTSNTSTPFTGDITGITSGTLGGPVTVNTTVAGIFRFVLQITDGKGNKSNELTGIFTVTVS